MSDSEEEASANDESSDDQTGSENHVVATRNATPTAAKQAAAPSILTVLRPPRPSELSWKRTIDRNPPPRGKKRLSDSLMHGAAERVFSVLNNSFGKRQPSKLEDYVFLKHRNNLRIIGQSHGNNRIKN